MRAGKEVGIPTSAKGLITGVGAGMVIGGLVDNNQALLALGLFGAFLGVTA